MTGYIDLQVNGYLGVDFSSPELTVADLHKVADALRDAGTCGFLATLVTAPLSVYARNLPLLASYIHDEMDSPMLGIHLEGPFISDQPGVVGAHRPEYVLAPELETLEQLTDWGGGCIRMLTVAAELTGAGQLIRYAADRGIAVSIGHSWYDEDDLRRAVDAGASALTHVGNGLPNQVNRHHNPIWAAAANDDLTAMVIADGHHLPEALLRTLIRAKTPDRIVVVSDSAPVAGLPPGRYDVLGNRAVLEPSGLLHNPEKQCLVGSTAVMRQCADFLETVDAYTPAEQDAMLCNNALALIGEKRTSCLGETK